MNQYNCHQNHEINTSVLSHVSVIVLNQTLELAPFELKPENITVEGMEFILSGLDYIIVGSQCSLRKVLHCSLVIYADRGSGLYIQIRSISVNGVTKS